MIGTAPPRRRSATLLGESPADAPGSSACSPSSDGSSVDATRDGTWPLAVRGALDIAPMTIGVVPLAITIGVVLSTSGLSTVQALSSGPIILAGTSQLAALEMLASGAVPGVIVLSAIMLNLRIMLYSAAFAPWFQHDPIKVRLLLAIPIVDQLYFTCIPRFERGDLDERGRRAYLAGAGVSLYGVWWMVQLAAYAVGPRLVVSGASVSVLAPLALVGLVARSTRGRAESTAAVASAVCAWAAAGVPCNGALPLAIVVGIALGSVRPHDRPDDDGGAS